jgi:hypothetical protein
LSRVPRWGRWGWSCSRADACAADASEIQPPRIVRNTGTLHPWPPR